MGVQFDEDNFGKRKYSIRSSNLGVAQNGAQKGIIGWLIKKGIVKDTVSANVILVIMTVLILIASGYIFRFGTVAPGEKTPTVEPEPLPLELLEN